MSHFVESQGENMALQEFSCMTDHGHDPLMGSDLDHEEHGSANYVLQEALNDRPCVVSR